MGGSYTDIAFMITQITEEKHCESNKETRVAFVDFENAFVRVDRNILWQVSQEKDTHNNF